MMSSSPSFSKIGYIILFAKDVEACAAFYRDSLGIPIKTSSPGWTELETQGVTLALHHAAESVPFHQPAIPEVVFNVEDVVAAHATLKDRKVKIHDLKQVWAHGGVVGVAAEFHDPEGNRLSIHGVVPAAQWTTA